MTTHDVLIIGGGIAGPALALQLHALGIRARIYEAYPRSDSGGGGFSIAPNGMRVLAELGLADAITAEGAVTPEFCFRNHHGKLLARLHPGGDRGPVMLRRDTVYRVLATALAERGIEIHYGKRLAQVTDAPDAIVADFADGSSARGSLLVGADGVHSMVRRRRVLPDHPGPRYTGMLAIGAFIPGDVAVPDPEDRRRFNFTVGPRLQFGYANLRETGAARWAWWCHLPQPELPRGEVQAIPDVDLLARAHAAFDGWHAPIGELLAATPSVLRTPIYDIPVLPTWHAGRAVLVGDAAHAMSPSGGMGVSMALEDTQVLAGLLRDSGDVPALFARFERVRRRRVEPIVAQAYKSDQRTLGALGPAGQWIRDRMLPMFAPLITRALTRQYAGPAAQR